MDIHYFKIIGKAIFLHNLYFLVKINSRRIFSLFSSISKFIFL